MMIFERKQNFLQQHGNNNNKKFYLLNFIFILFVSVGNAVNLIDYTANGEASDWMLGKLGIISLSPELGDDNIKKSDQFYPDKNEIVPILE